jgi:hypothetical protein
VKANAGYMAKNLKQHGWQYIVVDIQWSEPNAKAHGYRPDATLSMDEFGRLTPAVNRFPSAADGRGFKPLADCVHGLGLKFGIHIMRGIPRRAVRANLPVFGSQVRAGEIADQNSVCPWNTDMYGLDMTRPEGQDYYDSIIQMYAGWGVDYIKADDIARPTHHEEIVALRKAINKSGRPIVVKRVARPGQSGGRGVLSPASPVVARLGRLLGRLEVPAPELHAALAVGRSGAARRMARWGHAAPGPPRNPRRARRAPQDQLHARRAAHHDQPLVHGTIASDVRRPLAGQRRVHQLADYER